MPNTRHTDQSRPAPVLEDVNAFAETLVGQHRFLGLDLGTKTIGLALSDIAGLIASPYDTIRRTKFTRDAERLSEIIDEHAVAALVLGLPRNLDGSEGPRAQSTRAFARNLARLQQQPILLWDERLTTAAAERVLLDADTSRARRAEVVDKIAATLILQGALDRLSELKR